MSTRIGQRAPICFCSDSVNSVFVRVVLGEPALHRHRLRTERHAQVTAAHLLHDLVALRGGQPVEDARGLADARRDLQRGQPVNRAAAIEEVDRRAAELGEREAGGEYEQRAAEERTRQQRITPTRSTAAAST